MVEFVELFKKMKKNFKGDKPVRGEISLRCFQDLQNGKPFLDRSENVVICGNYRVPFTVRKVIFC